MLLLEMDGRWNTYGFKLLYLALVIILYDVHGCTSLNSEGLALLELRSKVNCDPHGILANWNPDHCDPCKWSRVQYLAGKVQMLDLHGHSLEGRLTPELGNLTHLRSIVLSENNFFGVIPKEVGRLRRLEVLDLTNNNLSGRIPAEIGDLHSLRSLRWTFGSVSWIDFAFGLVEGVIEVQTYKREIHQRRILTAV